ncbi:MAG: dehydrogenase [Omnitrophica bacterium RIFCSPLOWO2_01_FULL_45_10]|nr:MAG: dehydrogenase [Omnitrophica bacterium RIFCSPLOWO2_01_FULL_45_10]
MRNYNIPKHKLIELYILMSKIRMTELKIEELYPNEEMKTPVHLCVGQEAIAAAISANLNKDDYCISNHRGHGHYIAKGGDLKAMIAELYCKETGCSKGRGGSMHLVDLRVGLLGSSSIVGGGIPIAVGVALAVNMRHEKRVSVVFFGDAATEEGIFYESVNFAVLKKLPVVFICENNFYSVLSHQKARQAFDNIYNRLEGCGIPGYRVDGCDAVDAYNTAKSCIQNARNGKGPSLIEARAYRWRGHAGPGSDYHLGARPKKDLDDWIRKCPLKKLKNFMLKNKIVTDRKLDLIETPLKKEVEDAFRFAQKSPLPNKEEISKYLYC